MNIINKIKKSIIDNFPPSFFKAAFSDFRISISSFKNRMALFSSNVPSSHAKGGEAIILYLIMYIFLLILYTMYISIKLVKILIKRYGWGLVSILWIVSMFFYDIRFVLGYFGLIILISLILLLIPSLRNKTDIYIPFVGNKPATDFFKKDIKNNITN